MGFASRSVSMIRYRVRGRIEGSFWEAVDEGVKRGSFREVHSLGDVTAMGWTSIEDFDDDLSEGASYIMGNYVALSLRFDIVRVPARILEIHFSRESKKHLTETGQRRLSSTQRRDLKDRLTETLKQQILPSIQVFDLVWNTAAGTVYFGTHALKARERMEEHFKKSFGPTLIPLIPYIRAEELLEDESERKLLEGLRTCSMIP